MYFLNLFWTQNLFCEFNFKIVSGAKELVVFYNNFLYQEVEFEFESLGIFFSL